MIGPDLEGIRAVLLDLEGTTTPSSFAYNVLFPYARARAEGYLRRNLGSVGVQEDLRGLHRVHAADRRRGLRPPAWKDELPELQVQTAVAFVHWLMDRDRKSTPLKSLQGRIWREGFRGGELRGELYPDVEPALRRWNAAGLRTCVFSSGSILAQKLIFACSTAGDLTPLLHRHFDTTTGHKQDPDSYRRIALALELKPVEVLFVSDVARELDAASEVGMKTLHCVRPGGESGAGGRYPAVRTLEEVLIS